MQRKANTNNQHSDLVFHGDVLELSVHSLNTAREHLINEISANTMSPEKILYPVILVLVV